MKNITRVLFGFVSSAVVAATPLLASAHVGYVLDHEDFVSHEGADAQFLIHGVTDSPSSVLVAGLVTLLVVGAIIYWRTRPRSKVLLANVLTKLASYQELLSWMARLSLGIALIGAGTANVFVSPVLMGTPMIGFIEIVLGFLFLLGFLLPLAYIGSIALFLVGLTHSNYVFGNMDFLALVLSSLLLASARPGLDDILHIKQISLGEKAKDLVPLVLRFGLGIAFIFLAVYEKFMNPHDSALVVQMYHLTNVIPVSPALWVLGAGMVEFLLGVLLIIGFEVRLVAIVSFVVISLSFFYFKESVYSHVTLFGAISMLVVTGAGKYSVDRMLKYKA